MDRYTEDRFTAEEQQQEAVSDRRIMGRLVGGVEEPHLKDYLHVVLMKRWVVIGISLLVIIATALKVFLADPIYEARCLLLIEPTKIKVTDFQDVYDPTQSQFAGSELARREFMETQFRLLTCRPVLEKVFARFDFGEQDAFRDSMDPIPAFGELFSISPVRRTRLVEASFEWTDPKLAADVVNYLVGAYVKDYRERRLGVTGGGLAALKMKAEEFRPKVAVKAEALQMFMIKHGAVSLEQSQNIVVERLKDLNRELTEIQNDRIELQSRIQSIGHALDSRTPLEDLPEVVVSPTMRDLKMEWLRIQQVIPDLSKRFGQNHPELMAAKAKLRAIRNKIELEVRSILSSTHLEYQRAKSQEEELMAALNLQMEEVMHLDKLRMEYQILKDAHDSLNKTYRAIIQRIDEIEISSAAGSEEDNIFVISPARVPVKRSKPRRLRALIIACLMGPTAGIGLAFFLQYLDTTVKTREEVERVMGVPVIGYVPTLREELNGKESDSGKGGQRSVHDMLAVEQPRSALAEAFRSLRTALSFSVGTQGLHSLLVTSPSPLEGKSLVSINLAITFAQAGKKVLLVDADLRKPRLHKTFALPPHLGLSNLLAAGGEDFSVSDAVHPTGIENLYVMASGPKPPNPAELIATGRMKDLLREMGEHFDQIVFDTPPVINVTDASILMHFVDGGVVVIRSFTTQRGFAQRASELLQGTQGRLLGTILNNADLPKGAYGYEGYYYYSSYNYYYGDSDDDTGSTKKKRGKKRQRKGKDGKRSSPSYWKSLVHRQGRESDSSIEEPQELPLPSEHKEPPPPPEHPEMPA